MFDISALVTRSL